jgi:hypothetical protein
MTAIEPPSALLSQPPARAREPTRYDPAKLNADEAAAVRTGCRSSGREPGHPPAARSSAASVDPRGRGAVGSWCFVDDMGPPPTTSRARSHRRSGLQNVDWLMLAGDTPRAIRHRAFIVLRLLLVTAGHGACHSEVLTGRSDGEIQGVQPASRRCRGPRSTKWTPARQVSCFRSSRGGRRRTGLELRQLRHRTRDHARRRQQEGCRHS